MLIAGGGGGHSAAMKTCPERKKRMREFYLREKNVTYTYTSNVPAKRSFVKEKGTGSHSRKFNFEIRISRKNSHAEQLSETLKRIFHHIIP